jgi:hypothetical protein
LDLAFSLALKWSLVAVGGIVFVAFLAVGFFLYSAFGPGWTMHDTARILVRDAKFGMRAQARAIRYGDAILPLIVSESKNFEELGSGSAFWIAEVIGHINTEQSKSIATDLYRRPARLPHLVGAVALAEQGTLDTPGVDDLIGIVAEGGDDSELQLAMLALGKARAVAAAPVLIEIVKHPARQYWNHAYACDALARLCFKGAIPTLQSALESSEFYALPNAFRALITLGDRKAVPLAIARIGPKNRDDDSGFIVKDLGKVTGRHFGYNKQAWMHWWHSVQHSWSIPDDFRKPYDEQPPLY